MTDVDHDALDRLLDDAVRGRWPDSREADPIDAIVVRRLFAADRSVTPDRWYLAELRKRLMNGSVASVDGPRASPRSSTVGPVLDHGHRFPGIGDARYGPNRVGNRGRRSGRPWIDVAAVATVVLLVFAVVVGNGGRHPGDGLERGSRASAPDGLTTIAAPTSPTPTAPTTPMTLAAGPFIDISECDTQARPPDALERALESDPTIPGVFPPLHSERGWEGGETEPASVLRGLPPADEAALDAIGNTLRQLTACRFYSYDRFAPGPDLTLLEGRYFALFSDDYFRREFGAAAGTVGPGGFHTWWQPQSSLPLELVDPRLLPDGRVVGTVRSPASNPRVEQVLVFVEVGQLWLVDEVAVRIVGDTATPEASTRPTVAWDHVLEIAVADDQNVAHVYPDTFHANTEILVTIANLGTGAQLFEVPALGIVAEVLPGQSVDLVFRADVGDYRLRSALVALPESNATPNPLLRVGPRLDAEIHVVPQGQLIPRG